MASSSTAAQHHCEEFRSCTFITKPKRMEPCQPLLKICLDNPPSSMSTIEPPWLGYCWKV
jgi:hypothetical protein